MNKELFALTTICLKLAGNSLQMNRRAGQVLSAFALVAVNVAAEEGGLLTVRVYTHSFDIVAVVAGQPFRGDCLELAEDRLHLLV